MQNKTYRKSDGENTQEETLILFAENKDKNTTNYCRIITKKNLGICDFILDIPRKKIQELLKLDKVKLKVLSLQSHENSSESKKMLLSVSTETTELRLLSMDTMLPQLSLLRLLLLWLSLLLLLLLRLSSSWITSTSAASAAGEQRKHEMRSFLCKESAILTE